MNLEAILGKLTVKRAGIARLLALGCTNAEIALEMRLSEETIHSYRKHIYKALGIHSLNELVLWSIEVELVTPDDIEERIRNADYQHSE